MPTRTSLLLLLSAAGAAANTLRLRLANEALGNAYLSAAGERIIVLVPFGGVSAYVDVRADAPLNLTAATDESFGSVVLALDPSGPKATGAATLLIALDGENQLKGTVVWDADSQLGVGNTDVCQLRVLNMYPSAVTVSWGSADCVGCMRLPAFGSALPFLASGPAAGYASVACAFALAVELVAADGSTTSLEATLTEHGSYSIIVRNEGGAYLLPDVDGTDPYVPIGVVAAVLLSLGALHWLGGWLVVAFPSAATFANNPVGRFLGYHVRAARSAKASGTGVLSGDDGRRIDDAPLLPPDASAAPAGPPAAGAAAAAAAAAEAPRAVPPPAQRIRSIE